MNLADHIAGCAGLHRTGAVGPLLTAALMIPFAWLTHWLGGFPLVAVGAAVGCLKVLWAAPRATVPVIGDRAVGQWIALTPLSGGLWFAGVAPHVFPWPGWVGAFVMFNLIILLPPVRRLNARHPLLDDVTAALIASLVILVSAAVSHGWLS